LYSLTWGIILVFVFSFFSNVFPFFGASYTLFTVLQLTLLGPTPYNFAVLVLVSAIGAASAKVVIYFGAFGLKGILLKNKNVRLIGRASSTRKFYVVLFITAILPVFPLDDFMFIGAGATSASLVAMSSVSLLAKIIKSAFEVALELTILTDLAAVLNFGRADVTVFLSVLFVIIGVLVYKVDWEGTYRKLTRHEVSGTTGATPRQPSKAL
jgi:hypothetical protein